tara:strand:+ start:10366 stop:10533 length:168 start_codon:yes stop_codon:yes gene_type:complete
MRVNSSFYSKQYLYITSQKPRDIKSLKLRKKKKEKMIKNIPKDTKIIYAFFLDIA